MDMSHVVETAAYVNSAAWLIMSYLGSPYGQPLNRWDQVGRCMSLPAFAIITCTGIAKAVGSIFWG